MNEIDVIVHLMMGLPGETENDMLQTVKKMAAIDIQGIKFHCVNIMKNTALEELFLSGEYTPLDLEKYIDILSESIMWLPHHIVVHRLISDCNPKYLVAPLWASDKYLMLTEITRKFVKDNIHQGMYLDS